MADKLGLNKVRFHSLLASASLKNRKLLKSFIPLVFTAHKKTLASLDIILCSDQYLLDMNRNYLKHDTFTDIITFDLSDNADHVRGEIYISLDRVRENATTFGTLMAEELHRVIFHGILHLVGLNDKTRAQKQRMRSKEADLLKKYSCLVSRETRST